MHIQKILPSLLILLIILFSGVGCLQTLQNIPTQTEQDAPPKAADITKLSAEYEETIDAIKSEINDPEEMFDTTDMSIPEDTDEICKPEIMMTAVPEDASIMDGDEPALPADENFPNFTLDEALEFCRISQEYWQQGEIEKAIDALDQAYALILKVDTCNRPKLMQQIDNLRFMISKRILEIYASRNTVVSGKHDAIPLVMNQHVEAEIQRLSRGRYFAEAYMRSGKYRPMMVAELKKAGLPESLSWLPMIESGFHVNALSSARALGLWQFIPSTGYKFGLNRTRYVDERLDPEKSTKAAIEYLKELHQIFGDWTTVLAAYNCGEGRVLKVIRSQNINYLDNFWDLYEKLPKETAQYVPRFLATLHMLNNPEKYGIQKIETCPSLQYERVTVEKKLHLRDIASAIGVTEEVLAELNPELRYRQLPGESYSLKVPPSAKETLLAKLDTLESASSSSSSLKPISADAAYHRVRNGETLSTIASRYGITVRALLQANDLSSRHFILAGTTLKIPGEGLSSSIRSSDSKSRARYVTHKVKSGDSLWIIARRYGTTTRKIQRSNNLPGTRLRIGQRLKVPTDKGKKASLRPYYVKNGDIPFDIAKRHNMELERFLKVNHLTTRSKIYPGQKLFVE